MKTVLKVSALAALACVIACPTYSTAESLVEGAGKAAGYVGNAVGGTVNAVGGAINGTADKVSGNVDPKAARAEINRNTEQALSRLFKLDRKAKALFDKSYGYAVFDSRKGSFLITVGEGTGVAVVRANNQKTYMRMMTGGANLGAGMQFFQTVFLFETKNAFDSFVNSGWEAGSGANANFGKDAVDAQVRFVNGMALYQLVKTGINLSVDLTGTKYWKDSSLG